MYIDKLIAISKAIAYVASPPATCANKIANDAKDKKALPNILTAQGDPDVQDLSV